jgi:hypothetical protein
MRIVKQCLCCGKDFLTLPTLYKKKYCSVECRAKHMKQKRVEKTCIQCGETFLWYPKANNKALFCSCSCRAKYVSARRTDNRKEKVTCICRNCGKSFRVIPARRNSEFCSKACVLEYKRGVNACYWKGGRKYCELFNKQTKTNVRHAFHYRCAWCGKDEAEEKAETGKLLHIHHVYYDKSNGCGVADFRMNLIPLCCNCHSKTTNLKDKSEIMAFFGSIIEAETLGKKCYYEAGYLKLPYKKHEWVKTTYLGLNLETETAYY